jgi:hypothetical protein
LRSLRSHAGLPGGSLPNWILTVAWPITQLMSLSTMRICYDKKILINELQNEAITDSIHEHAGHEEYSRSEKVRPCARSYRTSPLAN